MFLLALISSVVLSMVAAYIALLHRYIQWHSIGLPSPWAKQASFGSKQFFFRSVTHEPVLTLLLRNTHFAAPKNFMPRVAALLPHPHTTPLVTHHICDAGGYC